MEAGTGHHLLRDLARVEILRAMRRQATIGPREVGVPEDLAVLRQRPAGQERAGRGGVFTQHVLAVLPIDADHFADDKAALGILDRWRQNFGECLLAESAAQRFPAADGTRHGGGINAA